VRLAPGGINRAALTGRMASGFKRPVNAIPARMAQMSAMPSQ
jgi:hypothetical protein